MQISVAQASGSDRETPRGAARDKSCDCVRWVGVSITTYDHDMSFTRTTLVIILMIRHDGKPIPLLTMLRSLKSLLCYLDILDMIIIIIIISILI
jgi:hypothetical protein